MTILKTSQDLYVFWNQQRYNQPTNDFEKDLVKAVKLALLQLSAEECVSATMATVCYTVENCILTRESAITFKKGKGNTLLSRKRVNKKDFGQFFFAKDSFKEFILSLHNVKKRFEVSPLPTERGFYDFFDTTNNTKTRKILVTVSVL